MQKGLVLPAKDKSLLNLKFCLWIISVILWISLDYPLVSGGDKEYCITGIFYRHLNFAIFAFHIIPPK